MKKILAIPVLLPMFAYADVPTTSFWNTTPGFTLAAGFVKSDAKFSELDHKEKLDGFFLNAAYNGLFLEYAKQSGKDNADFGEIGIGFSNKFYENKNFYGAAGLGLGYSKMTISYTESGEYDGYEYDYNGDYDLGYITLPLHFEVGYKLHPLASVFANVGYKWAFNKFSLKSKQVFTAETY